MLKLLIVEDDRAIVKLYETLLRPKYELKVIHSGGKLKSALDQFSADLIIMDVDLGTYQDGFDLSAELKRSEKFAHIPILFVTAQNSPDALKTAFQNGAEDYLSKPFQPFELVARVEHRIKRAKKSFEENRFIIIGELKLDIVKQLCTDGKNEIDLAPAEFQVLLFLARNSGKTVARKELSADALGERDLSPRLIDSYVSTLRKKIPSLKNRIESIYSVGYRLRADNEESAC